MRCGLTSFRSAFCGCNPRTTASPPQNGSTYLWVAFASQIGCSCETSQRLPPAHFSGGLNITLPSMQPAPECGAVDLRETQRPVRVVKRMQRRWERECLPVRQSGNEDGAQRGDQCVAFAVHDVQIVEICFGRNGWAISREKIFTNSFG